MDLQIRSSSEKPVSRDDMSTTAVSSAIAQHPTLGILRWTSTHRRGHNDFVQLSTKTCRFSRVQNKLASVCNHAMQTMPCRPCHADHAMHPALSSKKPREEKQTFVDYPQMQSLCPMAPASEIVSQITDEQRNENMMSEAGPQRRCVPF
jgi:hypothetical protein